MKRISLLVSAALLSGTASSFAQTVSFGYSNLANEVIEFHGTPNTFEFSNSNGRGFQITNADQPSLVGLKGSIGGLFTIGPITPMPGYEQATVTGAGGKFNIFDSDTSTNPLTADLTWDSVFRVGPAGILNPDEVFNLSNFQYTGSDPTLTWLANSMKGTSVLTFQFTPSLSLTQLTADNTEHQTSYSGTVATLIPEPSTYAGCMGLAVLLGVMWRRRVQVPA
jgi:PEP-CTERM motif